MQQNVSEAWSGIQCHGYFRFTLDYEIGCSRQFLHYGPSGRQIDLVDPLQRPDSLAKRNDGDEPGTIRSQVFFEKAGCERRLGRMVLHQVADQNVAIDSDHETDRR